MKNLVWATWIGWWRTPGRIAPLIVLLLLCVCGPSLTMTFSADGEAMNYRGEVAGLTGMVALFYLATGIISKERESGTLATIFARPVSRTTYVLSKWLALSSAVLAVALIAGLLLLCVYALTRPELIIWSDIPYSVLSSALLLVSLSSVMVLCSTFGAVSSDLSSFGGAVGALLTVLLIAYSDVPESSLATLPSWLVCIYLWVRSSCFDVLRPAVFFLFPLIIFPQDLRTVFCLLLEYFSNLSIVLMVASWLINRREVGYGDNG